MSNAEWWERIERLAAEADAAMGLDKLLSFQQVDLSSDSEVWRVESPLEFKMYAWLKKLGDKYGYVVKANNPRGRFRYDFEIHSRSGDLLALVECDSAEFHHTPEQLENDRNKDEAAKAAGIPLYRYTGKEIHRDAYRCAEETYFHIWPRGQ